MGWAFLLGLIAGAAGMWAVLAWLGQRPETASPPVPSAPHSSRAVPAFGIGEEAPDSMSQTAQRLVTDLERKFEGVVSAEPEKAPAPRRRRTRKVEPSTADEPD
jgi:hypothetical protein